MNNNGFNEFGYPNMNLINNMLVPNDMNNLTNNMPDNNNLNNMINNNQKLAGPYEGFIKGNLFNNLYNQYKSYRPTRLSPNNEQAELLLNVDQTTFAAHELKLYLDIYPNDTNMINLYNEYQKIASEQIKAYERKYGPLLADSPSANNSFSWEAYSWPWETEEM
ncbi:MAG: spore coat protein CotJB [Tenericutes bacterium]|nr:spore coat protein CotJB [Mycoplasmatota bacterium]